MKLIVFLLIGLILGGLVLFFIFLPIVNEFLWGFWDKQQKWLDKRKRRKKNFK